MVADELREMLVNEDSEHAFVFSDEEKEEFLFHIFKALAIGGTMMQYEDLAAPYFDTAKGIYKDFLTVYRNAGSGKVEIANRVCVTSLPSLFLSVRRTHSLTHSLTALGSIHWLTAGTSNVVVCTTVKDA